MAFLGVLMLETRFPRPPGDVGHPASFDMPVHYRVVAGASPLRVVRERAADLLPAFAAAARDLVAEGAAALTTSCGFMALWQRELQAALPVPVWTSALLQLEDLQLQRPGVIAVDAAALSADHLRAVGADPATPVEGIAPGSALARTLIEDRPELDAADAQAQVLAAAARLRARHPAIGAWVLECTNLPPYADALRRATSLPVYDVLTLVHSRWATLNGAAQRPTRSHPGRNPRSAPSP